PAAAAHRDRQTAVEGRDDVPSAVAERRAGDGAGRGRRDVLEERYILSAAGPPVAQAFRPAKGPRAALKGGATDWGRSRPRCHLEIDRLRLAFEDARRRRFRADALQE